jgi:hypothetical protein
MNFFLGYLIGRSLFAGPRRRARPGSALPLYGGTLLAIAGVFVAYWDGPNDIHPAGWLLAGFGAVLFLVGAVMQAPGWDDACYRPSEPHYDEPNGSGVLSALGGTIAVLLIFAGIAYLGLHAKGG